MNDNELQNKEVDKQGQKERSKWWILGTIGIFILSKYKAVFALLKSAKFLTPFISMMISVGAYALIFPIQFSIGLVLMIFIHECGHVIAAKRKGLPVSAPLFIPFMGALINMKRHPQDAETEAYIAYGGPLVGTMGAVGTLGLAMYLESSLLVTIAYVGFFINLLNLLPIHPLDGGRISVAVTRWLWLLGLIGGLAVIVWLKSILFFIIWVFFAIDLYQKYVLKKKHADKTLPVTFEFKKPLEPMLQSGMMIPGEAHRREIAFTTYSKLDGTQIVDVHWDMLDLHETIEMPSQALIEKVEVTSFKQKMEESGRYLHLPVVVSAKPFENDTYYEVKPATRWKFGLLYVGLALFLLWMMSIATQLPFFVSR
ncbi:site-2 protease family protein [Longirhabdus pacifica]|uniref:site-2 protease family protein n=1 Tax=Longirhabdus pacifica TaxID=2305227 RepID=UPI0010087CEF|nr:site-2 protease family protein [Longirhabdus pacifica]